MAESEATVTHTETRTFIVFKSVMTLKVDIDICRSKDTTSTIVVEE